MTKTHKGVFTRERAVPEALLYKEGVNGYEVLTGINSSGINQEMAVTKT